MFHLLFYVLSEDLKKKILSSGFSPLIQCNEHYSSSNICCASGWITAEKGRPRSREPQPGKASAIPPSSPSYITRGKRHGRRSAGSSPGSPAGRHSGNGFLTLPMRWSVSMTTATKSCSRGATRCR